ncbi:MAG: hypothetical protein ACM3OC_05945 [Deltaproteobacteria bacterium]
MKTDAVIEAVSVVLLFAATTASGWCAYQTVVWTSAGAVSLAEAEKAGSDAVIQMNVVNQLTTIDVNVFLQYFSARMKGDISVSEAIYRRFRPGLKKAVDAWLATDPFRDPKAPSGPFAMKEYWQQPSEEKERAGELNAFRTDRLSDTRNANENTDRYGLMTAMFAPLIFIGGVIPRFRLVQARLFITVFAGVFLMFALARLVTLPVTH